MLVQSLPTEEGGMLCPLPHRDPPTVLHPAPPPCARARKARSQIIALVHRGTTGSAEVQT